MESNDISVSIKTEKNENLAVVFLWFLRNFQEHLFLHNTSGGCFCSLILQVSCSNSPWSENVYQSAKRDLFPQSEGNCQANIMSNQSKGH